MMGGEYETDLFWKEPLHPRLKYSWIAKIIFLVFSKISFVNQTFFRSRGHSLKSSLLFA